MQAGGPRGGGSAGLVHHPRMAPLEAWLIGAFAVWRLTCLLHAEDGPWDVVGHWRERLGAGSVARMVDCFHCLSAWVALPFAAWIAHGVDSWPVVLVAWPSLSGAAIAIERLTDRRPAAAWFEEPPPDREELPR